MYCSSKKDGYDSKSEALLAASRYIKPTKRNGGGNRAYKLRAFRCKNCPQWHLTKRVRG